MSVILELERKILFKEGSVWLDTIRSNRDGKPLNGFRAIIFFEAIKYVNFEGSEEEAELEISLFWGFKHSSMNVLLSKFSGEIGLFKELVGRKIKLPVNPEPDFNDNSIYINYAHAPIDVLSINFTEIVDNKLVAELEMKFLGRFEENFQNLSTVKLIKLDILTKR